MPDIPQTTQEIVENERLNLLAIAHYVFGGLSALLSCVLIIHFFLGLFIATAPHAFGGGNQGPPTFVGILMSLFSACIMVAGWLYGGLTIFSGLSIKRRQRRIFSLVMAVFNCLSIPFGTVLGVCTILLLTRESVKRQYDRVVE